MAAGGEMGKARRLRQALTAAAPEHPLNGRSEFYLVTYRDVYRLDIPLRTHSRADDLTTVGNLSVGACVDRNLFMLTAQPGLGAPYGRLVPQ